MDKRKVIAAYRLGFITIQECAQIIGVDSVHVTRMVDDSIYDNEKAQIRKRRSVTS